MTKRMQCQVEMVDETATLYVRGSLGRESVETLVVLCIALPPRVRTLRLDLHALGQLSADAMSAVRVVLAHWRETRNGDFRLSTSHLMATLHDAPAPRPTYDTARLAPINDALAATFL